MLGRRLSDLLLQQVPLQQCCWAAAACLSTSAAGSAAADAAARAASTHASTSQGAAAAAASQSSRQPNKWLGEKQEKFLDSSFEQLHNEVQQQFALQSPQSEAMLLLLTSKASSAEQVQAAVDAVRVNHLKRCRIRQAQPFSPKVFNALVKAGSHAGLGHSFALQLLEQANQLGLQTSRSICKEVVEGCIKQKDYLAASRAWLYAQVYCAAPSTAAGQSGDAVAAEKAEAAWASKNLIKVYLSGMSHWLATGGISDRHKQRLQQQVEQLGQELVRRGAKLPTHVQEVLEKSINSTTDSSRSEAPEAAVGQRSGAEAPSTSA